MLTQKFSAPGFAADTVVRPGFREGQGAGLALLGIPNAWLGARGQGRATQLLMTVCESPEDKCVERTEMLASVPAPGKPVYLRVRIGADAMAQFSYSHDNERFTPAGRPFKASIGRWVGAQLALFSTVSSTGRGRRPHADFDYFRVAP